MGNSGCGNCRPPRQKLILYNVQNTDWANAVNNLSVTGVKMLLLQDPDLINQIVTQNGYIAVHVAVKKKNFELFKCLLKYGGSINASGGEHGNSCLHFAVINQDLKIIRLLFSIGCIDSLVNKYGKTAADLITSNKFRRQYMRAKNIYHNHNDDGLSSDTNDTHSDTSDTDTDTDDNLKDNEEYKRIYEQKCIEITLRDRNKFDSLFGKRIGCEVDEIAYCLQQLDAEHKLPAIWDKWVKKNKIIKKNDLVKVVYGLTILTLRSSTDYHSRKDVKPPSEPIKRLTTKIYKMLPIEKHRKKRHILTKHEFTHNFYKFLYDAHEEFVTEYNR